MASKIDMSLDELVQLKRKQKGGGPQSKGKAGQKQQWGGGQKGKQQGWQGKMQGQGQQKRPQGQQFRKQQTAQNGGAAPVSDLRDILATKQKTTVVDLRAKLGPKQPQVKKPKPAPTSFRSRPTRGTGQSPRSRPQMGPRSPPTFSAPGRSRRSDPGPIPRRHRDSPPRLPSYEEAKKITVTVPGITRPVSEYNPSSYRREERLAAAIARSKESRQDSYMRGREEFLASAITSALGGGSTGGDRNRSMGGGYPRVPLRYSRSPSPVADLGYESQYTSRSSLPTRPKGLTTMTSMIISNLSDTVSKNDVSELCGAVGPVEAILMPAPGMAEVIFKFKDDALEAFKKYNQRNLDGQPMMCKLQTTSRSRVASSGYGQRGLTDSYADNFYSHSSSFF